MVFEECLPVYASAAVASCSTFLHRLLSHQGSFGNYLPSPLISCAPRSRAHAAETRRDTPHTGTHLYKFIEVRRGVSSSCIKLKNIIAFFEKNSA